MLLFTLLALGIPVTFCVPIGIWMALSDRAFERDRQRRSKEDRAWEAERQASFIEEPEFPALKLGQDPAGVKSSEIECSMRSRFSQALEQIVN